MQQLGGVNEASRGGGSNQKECGFKGTLYIITFLLAISYHNFTLIHF